MAAILSGALRAVTACRTITLTPEQSAGLKEAQRFADEVTNAYRVQRVNILVYEGGSFEPSISWGRYIRIAATDLDRGNVREKIVTPVAVATLDWPPDSPTAETIGGGMCSISIEEPWRSMCDSVGSPRVKQSRSMPHSSSN